LPASALSSWTGKQIRVANAESGRAEIVASADAQPIGLTLDGNRVALAESSKGRGRVLSATLEAQGLE